MIELEYLAPLGNVNRSILSLSLGDDFRIEEWRSDDFVALYAELTDSSEYEAWFKLGNDWGYRSGMFNNPKFVYVIHKTLSQYPSEYGKHGEQWRLAFRRRNSFESRQEAIIDDKVLKLRLCGDGSIKVCVHFFYKDSDDGHVMESSVEETLHGENRPFRVPSRERRLIQSLLDGPPLELSQSYINFALENSQQSYRVAQLELEFIALMIALEALFNDGKQELRNKVARSCAVLIGKSKTSSRVVYKDVRKLYDKRSQLVHTGDRSKVSDADVRALKQYVRRSLARIVQLNLTKEELLSRLTEAGFGDFRRIEKI